jgi:hypothetical protein
MGLWMGRKADTRDSTRFISRGCLRRPGLRFMGKPNSRTLVGVSRTVRLWGSSRMLRILGGSFSCLVWSFFYCLGSSRDGLGQVKTRRDGR